MFPLYIYGAGGHGRVVFYAFVSQGRKVTGFIDDKECGSVCGLPVLSFHELPVPYSCSIHVAIGNNEIRQKKLTELFNLGILPEAAIHDCSVMYSSAQIGAGSLLSAGAILGPNALIGKGCIVNHNAVVDHDCIVGDFCHVAPLVALGGGVRVGELCLVGAGAIVLPGVHIGNRVTVGAGAVVVSDIRDGLVVVGNPARPKNKD
jgi:sugar O-acyltransferase (sialic acid O-acetyltransferase NeuD family)